MASKCRKFVPNIFNKTKCQTCFGSKDQHSAEALENNKASRKVSKCGYLFVAPGFDFNSPLDKAKRWQRRFFVLYDDGELAYSVDENPDTVPQGVVDMNKCTDVKDASGSTSHQNSLAVVTPEKTTYIKANSKEEIQWWHDVMIVYPRSICKPKQRRFTVPSYSFLNKENLQHLTNSTAENKDGDNSSRFEVDKLKQKDQQFTTYRGVRSMKHTKENKHYQDGLRKSSSLHDLSTDECDQANLDSSRFLSNSGDRLDTKNQDQSDSARLVTGYGSNPYVPLPYTPSWKSPANKETIYASNNNSSTISLPTQTTNQPSASETEDTQRRGSFDDKTAKSFKPQTASEKTRLHRERSASLKSFSTNLSLPKITTSVASVSMDKLVPQGDQGDIGHGSNQNETDEHKMAKSCELQSGSRSTPSPPSPTQSTIPPGSGTKFETSSDSSTNVNLPLDSPDRDQDLMYMKKGWLIKMGSSEKDWKKHWFVLTGNSLRYYKDANAEETNSLDGRIDLSGCYDISEVQIPRNYGFKIKTRNGEYILSAMTSGIRSNWMKAIKLCMDLQNSTINKDSKLSLELATSISSEKTNDDMDLDSSSSSSRNSDSSRTKEKNDPLKDKRKQFSDVNPGNVKVFSVSQSSGSSQMSSKEPSLEREPVTQQSALPPPPSDLAVALNSDTCKQYYPIENGSNILFQRFVEGSDSNMNSSVPKLDLSNKPTDKHEEDEKKKCAKSPSAKIKERSRAKSPKLHSPPPDLEQEKNFPFSLAAVTKDKDKISISSDDIDYMDSVDNDDHLDGSDIHPTMSSAGEGMLVDLLENEVESLKERLEHTQQELTKSQHCNCDLKTKLQTVVREKDTTQLEASLDSTCMASVAQPSADCQQVTSIKRQLKEVKDTVQKQKLEIDQFKCKLDMSTSKLAGTEKALSEALKDIKQEKDKFLKVTTEYNRKIKNLESQIQDVTQKMEKYCENSLLKDKENKKLCQDLKQTQQMLKDYEREVLKFKAVELESRQMKEKFEETEKIASRIGAEMKEKEEKCKKLELDYEEQLEKMMQEFNKERDDLEHHMEELKNQLLQEQKKSNIYDEIPSGVAEMIREKDEIIAQLEEKMIESEAKMVEMSEELKVDQEENAQLQHNIEVLQEERDNCHTKIKDFEKLLSQYQNQIQRMERENNLIKKLMDDIKKENSKLNERCVAEKSEVSSLVEDNNNLKSHVKVLEEQLNGLHEQLKQVTDGQERISSSEVLFNSSQELLHTFIVVTAEVNELGDFIEKIRKQFETVIINLKGDHSQKLTEMLQTLGLKCNNLSDILKEGPSADAGFLLKQKSASLESYSMELEELKKNNVEMKAEAEKWENQAKELESKFQTMQLQEEQIRESTKAYQAQLEDLNKRVNDFVLKSKIDIGKNDITDKNMHGKYGKSIKISIEIEKQLNKLDEKVGVIEKVLHNRDVSMSSIESGNQIDTDESDTENSDYTESDSDDDNDTESRDENTVAESSESFLYKLKHMMHQLQATNNKIKQLTGDMNVIESSRDESEIAAESELRQTLLQCEEKINKMTTRLSDGMKTAKAEIPRFSDNTWAFQKCVNKLKEKITDFTILIHQRDELNAKELKNVQEKFSHLSEFLNQIDKLGESDWDIAGKIAKQELKFQHLLAHKEKAARKSTLKYEDRLQLYADKLAFEALILGEMGIIIKRHQLGDTYKDSLLREIHEANLQIIELERRIDNVLREMNPSEQESDLVSSYAAILAEKIVLEGHLASGAMVQDFENSKNMAILSALNVNETPAVLAVEIFIRSQVNASVAQQLQKCSENMDIVSNHIITKALLQGEITNALQTVKKKFQNHGQSEDLFTLIKHERQFAFDELQNRYKLILDLLNETEPLVITTLIQLIEFSHGPAAPTLASVCDTISSVIKNKVDEFEKCLQTADTEAKTKIKHIISHLHSEMSDGVNIFKEEYQCYVQTASPEINPNVLKFSAVSLATELAEMFIQKAIVDGTFAYVKELTDKSPDVKVSNMMEPITENGGLNDLAQTLGQMLLTEAANKQKIAAEVKNVTFKTEGAAQSIANLVGIIPDLEAYPQSIDAYAATLVREAMFQSQLTYTIYKLKLHYHKELRDIKLKMEAGEKVLLPSEISREAESDIQGSLAVFEDILTTKYQDECEVLNQLEAEIGKLKQIQLEKLCSGCESFENNLKQLEKSFQHEISVARERQNVHLDVLRQEVNNVILRVDKFLEDHEKEKESLISDYQDRIATLQDEFDQMQIDHEEELKQVKKDILTAVSAIKEESETANMDQIKHQNKQLMMCCALTKELLLEMKDNMTADNGAYITEKIEGQLNHILKIESDPSFTLELSYSLPVLNSPGLPNTLSEPQKLDRSLSANRPEEHVVRLLERSQHEHEMEKLKREKEAALADEIKVTKAALDAMRKAYEEELEQEKEKYRHALKTMFTDNYVDDIRKKHDFIHNIKKKLTESFRLHTENFISRIWQISLYEDEISSQEVEQLREELKQVTMHYESSSEDYKLLEDRLARTKTEYQTHINQLVKSNEQLTDLVDTEIGNLKEFITSRSKGQLTGSSTLEEELYDSQIMVRVKDAELQKLRQQVKNLENKLERTTEEHRFAMTQYLQCLKKNQEIQAKLKEGVFNRERKDSMQTLDDSPAKSAYALRRNPSFHQRARSPSPDTSPRKDNSEHHSRDALKRGRSHLTVKDLKRSRSSPSLPFFFEVKGSAGSPGVAGRGGINSSSTRKESSKKS